MVRDGRDPLEHYPSKLMLTVLAGAATWEVGIARSSVYRTLHKHGRLNSMAQSLAKLWHRALILVAHGRQPPNCRPPRTRGDKQGCDQPRTFERPSTKLSDAIWVNATRSLSDLASDATGEPRWNVTQRGSLSLFVTVPAPSSKVEMRYGARRSTEAVVARIRCCVGMNAPRRRTWRVSFCRHPPAGYGWNLSHRVASIRSDQRWQDMSH
jgi:hypothetical protein